MPADERGGDVTDILIFSAVLAIALIVFACLLAVMSRIDIQEK